ncbi:MAG: hypothetical protein LBQ43_00885 [Holosporales bacterium]|nr:hypothetical protein [Holosporales bacterium]
MLKMNMSTLCRKINGLTVACLIYATNFAAAGIDPRVNVQDRARQLVAEIGSDYNPLDVPVECRERIRLAIENGSTEAQCYLVKIAQFYGKCNCPKVASICLKLAAAKGHVQAILWYGEHLVSGCGVEQNCDLGLKCISLIADLGEVDALNSLGIFYWKSRPGYPMDLEKSRLYLQRSASMGSINGQLYYGNVLMMQAQENRGTWTKEKFDEQLNEAEATLRPLCDCGNLSALSTLAIIHSLKGLA